jgi:hypothetical protein
VPQGQGQAQGQVLEEAQAQKAQGQEAQEEA